MHKKVLVGLFAMMAVVALASTSFAATEYKTLKVKRATANPNGVAKLMLETAEGSNSYTWYTCPAGSDDQCLAVGLTAISLTFPVRVGVDSAAPTAILEVGLDNSANL